MTSLEAWRADRHRSVTGAQGDLALIGLHEIGQRTGQHTTIPGLPGVWSAAEPDMPGLMLEAAAEDGIEVDGRPVHGSVKLETDHSLVRFSDTLTAQAAEQPGSPHLLAVWDASAEAVSRFLGIESYPFDPDWVIEAEFVLDDAARKIAFEHKSDRSGLLRYHESPGDLRFVKDGAAYTLRPFMSGSSLIVVFGDRTNGKTTYGMGRMLLVTPNPDGSAALDFNRAFLPPCAFSPFFNCPLPPAANRLPFEIAAGEMSVLQREG
ncbi:DUF1684 domain-containing protein [Cohnella lubricantis]|nr:DUF1684 domain-containing protein [Cohnella lubricantis]